MISEFYNSFFGLQTSFLIFFIKPITAKIKYAPVGIFRTITLSLISCRTFFPYRRQINQVYTVQYSVDYKKNHKHQPDFSIRNGKEGVFSYIDYIELLYSPIQTMGVVV